MIRYPRRRQDALLADGIEPLRENVVEGSGWKIGSGGERGVFIARQILKGIGETGFQEALDGFFLGVSAVGQRGIEIASDDELRDVGSVESFPTHAVNVGEKLSR